MTIDEIVAKRVKIFHLEMLNDDELSINLDDALIYISVVREKLRIDVIDKGKLEVREESVPAARTGEKRP